MKKIIFLGYFLFALYLAYYQLGNAPLANWDEAWYAEVTKQILKTHELVVLRWNNELWLEKPPMYMWLTAITATIIGLSEFSVRFVSALSGVIVIMLVAITSYRWYGFVPSLLAFSSIALNNIFIWRMRSGNIDTFVTLLIFLTYFVLLSTKRYKYPVLGILFACIFLTKASLVIFPLVIFIIYELMFKRKKIIKRYQDYLLLFGLFFLISGIWLYLGYLKVGPDFVTYALFKSDQGVAHSSLLHFNVDYIQHMYYSLQRRFFWVLLIGAGFALFLVKKQKKLLLLLLYGFLLFFQLSFTEKNNNWYLIPSMPFWSLLIAFGTYRIIKLFHNNLFVILTIILLSAYVSYKTFTVNITPILHDTAALEQKQSAEKIKSLTGEGDTIARLDHLYPTTIYYSDRHIATYLSEDQLVTAVQDRTISCILGVTGDIDAFKQAHPKLQLQKITVNKSEAILKTQ